MILAIIIHIFISQNYNVNILATNTGKGKMNQMPLPQQLNASPFFTGRKDVVDVDDIQEVLVRLKRSGTLPSSDTVVRQEMPLKPEVFHGRDGLIEEKPKWLRKRKPLVFSFLATG